LFKPKPKPHRPRIIVLEERDIDTDVHSAVRSRIVAVTVAVTAIEEGEDAEQVAASETVAHLYANLPAPRVYNSVGRPQTERGPFRSGTHAVCYTFHILVTRRLDT
jgi:hypothetical protein